MEEEEEEVGKYVRLLGDRVRQMKMWGLSIFGMTIGNFLCSFLFWMRVSGKEEMLADRLELSHQDLLIFMVCVSLGSALGAFRFDQLRRNGEVISEIISNETEKGSPHRSSLSVETRYVLRDFSRSSDLPLVPGKFGPAVICAVNLFVLFFVLFSICVI